MPQNMRITGESTQNKQRYYDRLHLEVAETLVHLGNVYGDVGNADKQRKLLEKAFTIQENRYGLNHPKVAKTLVHLGNTYVYLGNTYGL